MKLKSFLVFLECVSFALWIVFTIFSIALAGLGLEGIVFAAFLILVSSAHPMHFPLAMTAAGFAGIFLSIVWRQVGVDHFHYLLYDSPNFAREDGDAPSGVLDRLIREVESSSGYARSDARVKAKEWLIVHVASLDEEDIQLARTHLGYLLPSSWGQRGKTRP